jgi:glycosyltransferase involved in cell wall biosynthesis
MQECTNACIGAFLHSGISLFMKVAIVNPAWEARTPTPAGTLDRFRSLTGWAEAVRAAGATEVRVFQRFHADADVERDGISYTFVADQAGTKPPPWFVGRRLCRAVASCGPGIVHVNGLDHPRLTRRLRRELAPEAALVVQDHGGFDPHAVTPWRKAWMRHGLAGVDALLVATPPQTLGFAESGLVPSGIRVRDVMEASTMVRASPMPHDGIALLFVGRLNANKDPLSVLEGFARFLQHRPEATLTFVYDDATLEPEIRAKLAGEASLAARVTLRGQVRNERIGDEYGRADIFVLGSHFEGSGYAALEAMACGVIPVLADIPSFRWLTDDGRIGALWRVADAVSLGDALSRVASSDLQAQRRTVRTRFDEHFSWRAIGRRAMEIYRELSRT